MTSKARKALPKPLSIHNEPMHEDLPKILVVDDSQQNLVAMRQILKVLPTQAFFCTSGNEALALTLEHQFALILLDVMMPEMNGFEVAELMRQNELTRRIPIIFATALGKEEAHEFQGYEAGAVDYLLKPINAQILLSKVRVFIDLDSYQRQLQTSEERYRLLVERAPDIIYSFSSQRGGTYYSSRVEEILGYSLQQFAENPWLWNESIHPDDSAKVNYALYSQPQDADFNLEYRIKNAQGEWLWFNDRSISWRTEGAETIVEGIATDITERRLAHETLERLAKYDPLTGLANRRMFHDFQAKAFARAKRYQRSMAVLFLDLDNFKDINDSLGHDFGDKLLHSVATKLTDCVRSGDLVARLGGDEFAIVLDEMTQTEDAGLIAQKILDALAVPHLLAEREIVVSSSIGIAVYKGGEQTLDELNKHADIAMYEAKQSGRNAFQFFSPEAHATSLERSRLEQDLRVAIERDDFFVQYQPQIDVTAGKIIGVEALLRWQHAELGLIGPNRFLPLAENARIIDPIGEWVLRTVCRHRELLRLSVEQQLSLGVAVNVSARQLKQERFAEKVKAILAEAEFPPQHLEIELKESTLMDNPELSIPVLRELREYGVKIAIDDFGAGYSSLSYLKQLPIDTLKIDPSFIQDIGKDKNNDAIIKSIITLGNNLGLRVIAEGVETQEQEDFLQCNNCIFMQGYLFGRPMDFAEASQLIMAGVKH